ncbi:MULTISPECIES: sensor histidine kinase [unclassified Roseateles]|uniref:sensor histidine kinase n=1 Tax=unclassified Roseateles TaxID=2626991 RepID=UPI00138F70CB|nr:MULTISPECIES: sensor histidine kinase [unclassified Roseateles]
MALFTSPPPVLAVHPPLQIAQYAHTSWTARDGAPLDRVFATAQTPDGYLWVATSLGLLRFDGLRFVPWQPPVGQSLPAGPYSLLVSRDGTLWIGTFWGLSSWNGRQLTQYPEIDEKFVTSLFEDRDGTVWAGVLSDKGQLCAIRAGQVQCAIPDGGFGKFVWSLAQDSAGVLWAGADSGVWRWAPGAPRQYPMPGLRVGDLTTTVDGQVLVGVQRGGLKEVAGDHLVPHSFRRDAGPDGWIADRDIRSNKLLRDRDGGLWIGTDGLGLMHVKDGRADTFNRIAGLSGNVACSLFEDREGNIWYGSEKGIDRFRKLPVTAISTQQGLPDEVSRAVLTARDGSVWVSTEDGLARWRGGKPTTYRERDGLPASRVRSLYQDVDGRLWVSTAGGLAYFAEGRFIAVDSGPGHQVHAMTGDAQGNLWLATDQGLARLHQSRFVENISWAAVDVEQRGQVVHRGQVLIADQGGLWVSFWQDNSVVYFKDGKVQATYRPTQGRDDSFLADIRLDAEGAVWAATSGSGLSRIKEGRVTTLSVDSGLPCKSVHWSTVDDHGAMWMYTVCGLVRVLRDDLAAWIADPGHKISPTLWGAADGVPLRPDTPAYFNPPVAKGPDGKLWFISNAEVQVVDPKHLSFNPVPPPVHIDALVADRKSYPVSNDLRLPPLVRDMTIEFVALTFAEPKTTRFRYRLDGHDTDWREVVDRRQVSYTNLPPGNYRFHVKAANNSGVWNEEGAQLAFAIAPAFYQTAWFRFAAVIMLLALAWSGVRLWLHLRIRRLHRQFEARLEARLAERTRIARALHDTLLQHFHGLLLQFQAAFNLLPDRPRESRQILAGAIDRAAEAITEGRSTVEGLRTSSLDTHDLAGALRALVEELANEPGLAASAHVEVQGRPQALHPVMRDEAFRIAGEALRNAFHHADAKRIHIEIRYDPQQLSVRIRDDGRGVDPEVLRAGEKQGHFGLSGMRERAELVGGKLTLRSDVHAGTDVEFTAPASRAYSAPSSTPWWLPFKKFASGQVAE